MVFFFFVVFFLVNMGTVVGVVGGESLCVFCV